jgi:hypothetical protein
MKCDGSTTFDAASASWRDEVMSIEDFGYVEELMLAAPYRRWVAMAV